MLRTVDSIPSPLTTAMNQAQIVFKTFTVFAINRFFITAVPKLQLAGIPSPVLETEAD